MEWSQCSLTGVVNAYLSQAPAREPPLKDVPAREEWMSLRSALAFAVLVISLPLPLQAHDIYSHLRDKSGASCCDNRDCHLAPYRFTANGVQMLVAKRWIDVPSEKIQYVAVPGDTGETGGGHWCGSAYEPGGSASYITRCAILPPQSASAQQDPRLTR
jgi:hypothetical protein